MITLFMFIYSASAVHLFTANAQLEGIEKPSYAPRRACVSFSTRPPQGLSVVRKRMLAQTSLLPPLSAGGYLTTFVFPKGKVFSEDRHVSPPNVNIYATYQFTCSVAKTSFYEYGDDEEEEELRRQKIADTIFDRSPETFKVIELCEKNSEVFSKYSNVGWLSKALDEGEKITVVETTHPEGVFLKMSSPQFIYHLLQPITVVSVCEALSDFGFKPTTNIGNDIQLNGKKVCGVGVCSEGNQSIWATFVIENISYSLNVNMCPEELAQIDQPATSLYVESGKEWDRDAILVRINQKILENWYSFFDEFGVFSMDSENGIRSVAFKQMFSKYSSYFQYIGKEVEFFEWKVQGKEYKDGVKCDIYKGYRRRGILRGLSEKKFFHADYFLIEIDGKEVDVSVCRGATEYEMNCGKKWVTCDGGKPVRSKEDDGLKKRFRFVNKTEAVRLHLILIMLILFKRKNCLM